MSVSNHCRFLLNRAQCYREDFLFDVLPYFSFHIHTRLDWTLILRGRLRAHKAVFDLIQHVYWQISHKKSVCFLFVFFVQKYMYIIIRLFGQASKMYPNINKQNELRLSIPALGFPTFLVEWETGIVSHG